MIEHGRSVREISARLGVSIDSMFAWLRQHRKALVERQADAGLAAENLRLQAEVKCLTEEGDILKIGRAVLCQGVRAKHAFMKAHQQEFRVTTMCPVLGVQRTDFYAWVAAPASARTKEDRRLAGLVKQAWLATSGASGKPAASTGSTG